jgi:hypothetical protein
MDAGEDVPDCLVKTLLLAQEQEKLDWEDLCMLAVAFNLGGIHSVSINIYYLLGSRLILGSPFIDLGCYHVVPGPHFITPRSSSSSPCGAGQRHWPRCLAKRRGQAAPSVYSGHHQGGTLRNLVISCLYLTLPVSLGKARPCAVLGTAAALFYRRLCLQRDVYPEEHSAHSQLLRNPSQRGEVSGCVRTHFTPV